MKPENLVLGSIIAAGIVIALMSGSMVTESSSAKSFIAVNSISDKNAGEHFAVTGTTNVPPGSVIVVEISPLSFDPPADAKYNDDGSISGTFNGMIGTGTIAEGTGKNHPWHFEVDGTRLTKGNYQVQVSAPDADVFGTTGLRIR